MPLDAGAAPLRASDYQDPDDIARAAAEAADAAVAAAIDDGWDRLREGTELAALIALVSAANWVAIYRIIGVAQIADAMQSAMTRLVDVHDTVASAETRVIAAAVPPSPAIALTYDPLDTATVAAERSARDAVVQQLAYAAKGTLDGVIQRGIAERLPPDALARRIRDMLGLTDRQAMAIENYRRALEEGDPEALRRVLRDRRFDASAERAIGGEALDEAKIDRMVARYAERYQTYRAMTIARTETLRAANAGRRAAWLQYADRRNLPAGDVVRFWQTAADERVCQICRPIPLMNPSGVPLNGLYDTPDGPVRMPPDPHPSCRCTERYELRGGMQSAA